jgi:hypothetical protein
LAATALLIVAALGLSGCATMRASDYPGLGSVAPQTSKPTTTATNDASTVAKDAIRGKQIGDALTPEQAQAVQHNWQGNDVAYQNVDGSFTLVDRTAPLPDNVKADVCARVNGAAQQSKQNHDPVNNAVSAAMKSASTAAGRNIVFVVRAYTFTVASGGNYEAWVWLVPIIGDGRQYGDDLQSAQVAANQYASRLDDTEVLICG